MSKTRTICFSFMVGSTILVSCQGYESAINSSPASRPIASVSPPSTDIASVRGKRTWKPGAFAGIETGRTTAAEVKLKLGPPDWEGENTEKVDEESPRKEVLIQYRSLNDGEGSLDVVVDAGTQLVRAMAYFPARDYSRAKVIEKFGSEFIEGEYIFQLCEAVEKKTEPPAVKPGKRTTLAYPSLGMYAYFYETGEIIHFGYLDRCYPVKDETNENS